MSNDVSEMVESRVTGAPARLYALGVKYWEDAVSVEVM
jgi:hypothetical protein